MAMHRRNDSRLLPVIVIAASIAAVVATIVASFYGVYFFFFFVPLSFGLPWSIKKLRRNRARKQWNVEDLR
jgi:dolichyl-phosphate-mannose--protein O-mannosyl transferase